MKKDNVTIKGLWIGKELSPNELLSIQSYLYHGHHFELFVYDEIKNVPKDVVVKDANQIIPESEIFIYSSGHHKKSVSMFSDLFRYKLLYNLGGWWSDLDAICLKPYDIDQEYVFMQEKQKRADDRICGGVLKCPESAPIMEHCYEITLRMRDNIQNLAWTATGPMLLGEIVNGFSLSHYVVPTNYFAPIGFFEIDKLFTDVNIGPETYSIHLYNEVWNMRNMSKYGVYPKNSLFESLKKQYSVRNNYLKMVPEFIGDIKNYGFKRGHKIVYSKLWHMYKAFS